MAVQLTSRRSNRYPELTRVDAADVPLWMNRLAVDMDDAPRVDQGPIDERPPQSAGAPGEYGVLYQSTDELEDGVVRRRHYASHGQGYDELASLPVSERMIDSAAKTAIRKEVESLTDYNLQVGVISGGGVTRLSSSSVRVLAGRAWVPTGSGLYRIVSWNQTDLINIPVSTGSRLDQIIVRSSGSVERLAGAESAAAATADAGLNARAGAAALPADSIRLEDLLANGGGLGADTHLRDRRPWSSGWENNFAAVGTQAFGASGAWRAYAAGHLTRVEQVGAFLEYAFTISATHNGVAAAFTTGISIDGATPPNATGMNEVLTPHSADWPLIIGMTGRFALAAGSHTIQPIFQAADPVTYRVSFASGWAREARENRTNGNS